VAQALACDSFNQQPIVAIRVVHETSLDRILPDVFKFLRQFLVPHFEQRITWCLHRRRSAERGPWVIPTEVEGSHAVCGAQAIALASRINPLYPLSFGHSSSNEGFPIRTCQLLASPPALNLLLALDGSQRIIKLLVIDKPLDAVFSGEAPDQSVFVFVRSTLQIRSYSDVEHPTTARENINVKLSHPPLGTLTGAIRERQMA
jgi:hypothetical protein